MLRRSLGRPAPGPPVEPACALPQAASFYRRTDVFSETSVPAGLLKSHSTKDGVWGLIRVLEGELAYRITDPRRIATETRLDAQTPGVVEPTILHEVAPCGPVRFFVEFFRAG